MDPVSGRDSSILAHIAQNKNISGRDLDKLIGSMESRDAKTIALYLAGRITRVKKEYREAADFLRKWAKEQYRKEIDASN